MANIKSMADIASKWAEVTPGRAAYYENGVRTTTKDWAAETAAAEPAYQAGVSDAISRNAFSKGVQDRGTAGWREPTLAKKGRWAEGVRLGQGQLHSWLRAHARSHRGRESAATWPTR